MAKKVIFEKTQVDLIVSLYTIERDNIKNISRKVGTSAKIVRRILIENKIKLDGIKNRFYRTLTDEHKKNISKSLMGKPGGSLGLSRSIDVRIKYSESQLKLINFSLDEFKDDYTKFRFIMRWVVKNGIAKGGEELIYEFIKRFYNDKKLDKLYSNWIFSNKNKWYLPTLDHKIPISRGGNKFDLENMEILTWFENRAKAEMTREEWEKFKINTGTKSLLFI
jgi:hypothetical protein